MKETTPTGCVPVMMLYATPEGEQMHRKDYMLLASIINDIDDAHVRKVCAIEIAYGLQKADRSFQIQLFLDVCLDASKPRTSILNMNKRPEDTW
jgi:hypothetical protein